LFFHLFFRSLLLLLISFHFISFHFISTTQLLLTNYYFPSTIHSLFNNPPEETAQHSTTAQSASSQRITSSVTFSSQVKSSQVKSSQVKSSQVKSSKVTTNNLSVSFVNHFTNWKTFRVHAWMNQWMNQSMNESKKERILMLLSFIRCWLFCELSVGRSLSFLSCLFLSCLLSFFSVCNYYSQHLSFFPFLSFFRSTRQVRLWLNFVVLCCVVLIIIDRLPAWSTIDWVE
jgi:hypothetical protein